MLTGACIAFIVWFLGVTALTMVISYYRFDLKFEPMALLVRGTMFTCFGAAIGYLFS